VKPLKKRNATAAARAAWLSRRTEAFASQEAISAAIIDAADGLGKIAANLDDIARAVELLAYDVKLKKPEVSEHKRIVKR